MAEKARVLKVEETTQWGRVIWLEMREMREVIPVTYHSERLPFMRYVGEQQALQMEVRAAYYGKTWRCWDQDPRGRQSVKVWDDDGAEDEAQRRAANEKPARDRRKAGAKR